MVFDRADVTAAGLRLGFTKITAEFSGGNDEGGVESVSGWKGDDEFLIEPLTISDDENLIHDQMEYLVSDRYNFDGGNEINGTLAFDLIANTLNVEGSEQEWVEFSHDLDHPSPDVPILTPDQVNRLGDELDQVRAILNEHPDPPALSATTTLIREPGVDYPVQDNGDRIHCEVCGELIEDLNYIADESTRHRDCGVES